MFNTKIHSSRWKCGAAFVFLAGALSSVVSRAADIPSGAWQGVIGKSQVMVCFSEVGDSQYYYLRHQRPIHLEPAHPAEAAADASANALANNPAAIAAAWQSGQYKLDELSSGADADRSITGHWRLQARSAKEVVGTWTGPGNDKMLPISLTKAPAVAAAPSDGINQCERAYYEPIFATMRLSFVPTTFAGHAYREVSSEQAAALDVPASLPHAQALNRYAIEWLRSQAILASDCNADLSRSSKKPADPLSRVLAPVVWTNEYLVLKDALPEIYCGGMHGTWSITYLTWSWAQGAPVDTWSWLRGGEKSIAPHEAKDGERVNSDLFRLIVKHHPRNDQTDECHEAMDAMSVQAPYPTALGLVFNTDFYQAMRACNDEVVLEWKQLAPYLSAKGLAVARQFHR